MQWCSGMRRQSPHCFFVVTVALNLILSGENMTSASLSNENCVSLGILTS